MLITSIKNVIGNSSPVESHTVCHYSNFWMHFIPNSLQWLE